MKPPSQPHDPSFPVSLCPALRTQQPRATCTTSYNPPVPSAPITPGGRNPINPSTAPADSLTGTPGIPVAGAVLAPFSICKIPNRKNTSLVVTKMLITINTMTPHVRRLILRSAIESLRISARSKKTRQRSFSTWMRGLISRYSRTAM